MDKQMGLQTHLVIKRDPFAYPSIDFWNILLSIIKYLCWLQFVIRFVLSITWLEDLFAVYVQNDRAWSQDGSGEGPNLITWYLNSPLVVSFQPWVLVSFMLAVPFVCQISDRLVLCYHIVFLLCCLVFWHNLLYKNIYQPLI